MKRLAFMLLFLGGITSLPAQENGIDQDLELVTYPTGEHVIAWYGHVGRSYFLQFSDSVDHLNKWHWENIIEGGNDEPISHEVGGTGDKVFYRLKYTDQVPGPGEDLDTADFDGDGISNWDEISLYHTDPLNSDSDADGMPDGWEVLYGLDPRDPADASGDLVGDGVSNLVKYQTGRNPLVPALADDTGALALKVHTPLE